MNQSRKPAGSPGGSGGQFDSNGGQFNRSELPDPTGMTVTDSGIVSAPGARLRGADLSGRELDDMTGADLIDANLEKADLSAGRLDRAHLEGANARGANFFHASLDHTHMATADLKGARMRFANLDHTDMRFTDLSQATLEGGGHHRRPVRQGRHDRCRPVRGDDLGHVVLWGDHGDGEPSRRDVGELRHVRRRHPWAGPVRCDRFRSHGQRLDPIGRRNPLP